MSGKWSKQRYWEPFGWMWGFIEEKYRVELGKEVGTRIHSIQPLYLNSFSVLHGDTGRGEWHDQSKVSGRLNLSKVSWRGAGQEPEKQLLQMVGVRWLGLELGPNPWHSLRVPLLMGNLRMAFALSSSGAIGKRDGRGQEITVVVTLLLGAIERSWGVFFGASKAYVSHLSASPRGSSQRLAITRLGGEEAVGSLSHMIPAQPPGALWPVLTFPYFCEDLSWGRCPLLVRCSQQCLLEPPF